MTARTFPVGVYLDGIETFLRRYVAFPSEHEPVAVALWVAHVPIAARFETSPYLLVTSPEYRSGKTRLLECIELLVPRPLKLVTPSAASIYTALDVQPPHTLLFDELDAIFGRAAGERYEEVRGILNAGNRKGAYVLRVRMQGQNRVIEQFDPFGPKALAGIGKLPDTIADRGIPIRMRRRAPAEKVAKFRRRDARLEAAAVGVPLWPDDLATEAVVPDDLNDRAAEGWETLVAVAEAAGGTWPARSRLAALALSGSDDQEVSVGMKLLADIQAVFGTSAHLATADLLAGLHAIEDAPWGDWYGKALSARALARMLAPYGVRPTQERVDGVTVRGYFARDLLDAWARYAPSTPLRAGTSVTSGTAFESEHKSAGDSVREQLRLPGADHPPSVTDGSQPVQAEPGVTDVPLVPADSGVGSRLGSGRG